MRFRAKMLRGDQGIYSSGFGIDRPPGGNLGRNFFFTSSQQTSLWRRFLGIDSSEIKEMPKIFGNQLQPPLLGWKPINNITSYERTDAFPSVHLLLDIIFYANTLNHLFIENPFSFGKHEEPEIRSLSIKILIPLLSMFHRKMSVSF